jgi:acetate kinase
MKIIVCNIGSTSFKFQLIEMTGEAVLASGSAERVGAPMSTVTYRVGENCVWKDGLSIPGHHDAVRHALEFLTGGDHPVLSGLDEVGGIGFKTVQAGEKNGSVLLDDEILDAMDRYRDLAPAHNPPYLAAIEMFRALLPGTPMVGVFEPGFHVGIPDHARIYGTPWDWIEDHGVRRYGYHGASHRFVTGETVRVLGLPWNEHRIISCHLGGSSSVCAFKNGVSIDTSMGFTPQSGVIQGTRIGDMDPFVLPYIMARKGITLDQALQECSRNAGLAGLSGTSGDMRDINAAIRTGNRRALLARRKFIYDIKRYVGEYLVLLEGLDAIAFAGGIGQKDDDVRAEVLSSLRFLGLLVDEKANRLNARLITLPESRIKGLVLETNEEIIVARETLRVLEAASSGPSPTSQPT